MVEALVQEKVMVPEMVQVVVEMNNCHFLYLLLEVHPSEMKVHEIVQEVVQMKLKTVPCFLVHIVFYMPSFVPSFAIFLQVHLFGYFS